MIDDVPAEVRTAFGMDASRLVLKSGQPRKGASWLAEVFAALDGPGFRVPRPVRARDGSWVVDGWAAWTAVEGEPAPVARWPEVVAAGRAFHAALAGVPKPAWLGRDLSPWTVADRVAWSGDDGVEIAPELADLVRALWSAVRPVRLPSQLIHGDLAGNVLFADGQPPAVTNFAPGWRPAGYALAIAAVDLLAWHGAPPGILAELSEVDEIDQLLLRALAYRLVTESLCRPDAASRQAVREANEPVVDLVLSRVSGRPATTAPVTDRDLAELAGHALGRRITGLRPAAGGHTRAMARIADRADGESVFLKAAGPGAGVALDVELTVYEALGERPFLPRLLAGTRSPVPMLALEALEPDGWVRDWTPPLIEATGALLHDLHRLPAPPGLPRAGGAANPWDAIGADPARLLRMEACSTRWLATHFDTLRAAAAGAPLDGDSLIHRDVRAANLWYRDGRVVLVDWASAAIGDPWFDHHLWLVAVAAEGGPPPDLRQGPHAAGHAALIAGQQPLFTPARDTNLDLYQHRCRRLAAALSWAARLLDLPPP